jgi:serine/threonine protein kinase
VPEFIGRYKVRRSLGAGGFAVVWLAYDDRLDDEVAIKVLAENFAQRIDLRERFVKEARVLRHTKSHRIVEVYDIDELPDGRPYFVMTYAAGGSLADRLTGGWLPADQVLRYGADIALGIHDLHDAGVIHRDVKPSNVLFRSTDEVIIADLGLSRDRARGSRITMAAGTPGFMSPEQADGEIDHRADIYGIGATVYYALTRQLPDPTPVPPSALRPGLPAGTDDTILRALAHDPGQRWPAADLFAEALLRLSERADTSPPAPAAEAATEVPATGEVVTVQLVQDPFADKPEQPEPVSAPRSPRRRWGILAAAMVGVIALTAALLSKVWTHQPSNLAQQGPVPAPASAGSSAPPTVSAPASSSAQPPPSTTPSAPQPAQPIRPNPAPAISTTLPVESKPLPGTLTRCSVAGGRDSFDCFVFSRGNTAYALDFYAHNYEVVMWERKPDSDAYAWSQRWQFWRIEGEAAYTYLLYNPRSARCLTVDGQGGVGAPLLASPCDPRSPNQLWQWTDATSWILRSKLGNCLDVPRGEYFMGQRPFLYDCNGQPNQRWLLSPT